MFVSRNRHPASYEKRFRRDKNILFRVANRGGATRGIGTFHNVLAIRMHQYGRSFPGDPRT